MLAKIWKKILLAICIIACIYNIMSKIINRHSLEENLKSVNNGQTTISASQNENIIVDEESKVSTEESDEIKNETDEKKILDFFNINSLLNFNT